MHMSKIASLGCYIVLTQLSVAHAQSKLWSERNQNAASLMQMPSFSALAEQVIPAVVSIQVEQRVKMNARGMPGAAPGMPQDPFEYFHRYFGGEVPREFRNRGLGSGFVIDASGSTGLILTNYHVVEEADSIEVTLQQADGSELKVNATILGTAPEYDVALLKTDSKIPASIAYLGDSEKTKIGDWVMAVGNPFGLSHSVSVGIISAKERRDVMPSGRHGLYNFLQTDASINPGNSGGPLVNTHGEVIGINSAINAAGSGIGFAIPINMVKDMLPDLKNKGHYTRSWLGIKIQPLTQELAQSYHLSQTRGALISEVVPNGPAAEAKLREGDIVLQFDGKEIRNSSDLPLFASMAGVGKKIELKVWREGQEINVTVKLTEFPDENATAQGANNDANSNSLGMTVIDLTQALQQQLGIDGQHGVVIKEVQPTGLAARAGIRPGDVIQSLNGKPIGNARAFVTSIRKIKSGDVLRMKINRQGAGIFLALRKP